MHRGKRACLILAGAASPWTQEVKKKKSSRGNKRPGNPEAQEVAPAVGGEPEAKGRADVVRMVVPGTAAHHPQTCISALGPSTAIGRRRSTIVVMPRVLD